MNIFQLEVPFAAIRTLLLALLPYFNALFAEATLATLLLKLNGAIISLHTARGLQGS